MCDIACDIMFGRLAELKEMVLKEVEKFRQKGAVTPEKAMSIEELGLSPRFKIFLRSSSRLLGVFVKVDNKYYLSEERLKEIEKQGLFDTIEQGIFAGIKRPINGGKGLDGVIQKDKDYYNPFLDLMIHELLKGGN